MAVTLALVAPRRVALPVVQTQRTLAGRESLDLRLTGYMWLSQLDLLTRFFTFALKRPIRYLEP